MSDPWECLTSPCSRVDRISIEAEVWKRVSRRLASLIREEVGLDPETVIRATLFVVTKEMEEELS